MRTTIRIAAGAVAGVIALGVTAGSAGAATNPPVRRPMAVVRAECNRTIDHRVRVLHDLENRIEATQRLSPEQKAPMVASIEETVAVLQGMYRPAVNTATTRAALLDACRSVFVDLRIFAVYVPQVRYGAQIDALSNLADALDATGDADLVASARASLSAATTLLTSVTPASFNADPAGTRATWDAVHDHIRSAFLDLLEARPPAEPPAG